MFLPMLTQSLKNNPAELSHRVHVALRDDLFSVSLSRLSHLTGLRLGGALHIAWALFRPPPLSKTLPLETNPPPSGCKQAAPSSFYYFIFSRGLALWSRWRSRAWAHGEITRTRELNGRVQARPRVHVAQSHTGSDAGGERRNAHKNKGVCRR